jgi:hypothetical protein
MLMTPSRCGVSGVLVDVDLVDLQFGAMPAREGLQARLQPAARCARVLKEIEHRPAARHRLVELSVC